MKYFIVFLTFAFLHAGCIRDANMDIKKATPRLVINSVTATGNLFEVQVSSSQSIYSVRDMNYDAIISNAVVTVFRNNQFAETLIYSDSSRTYRTTHTRPQPGSTYRIEVSANGLEKVSASSSVPENVPIETLAFTREARKLNGNSQSEAKFSFADINGSNYYSVVFNTAGAGYQPCIYCKDAAIEKIYDLDILDLDICYRPGQILFTDQTFANQTKEIRTYIDDYYTNPDPPHYPSIELQHITLEYFNFLVTINLNELSQDNPFAEPANVKGNIENGFGIFTIYNSSKRPLR